jgi:GxxExxY protein
MTAWSPNTYPHQDLTSQILSAFYEVYNHLGHGFTEAVYERALANALSARGLGADRQPAVTVWFQGRSVGRYRTDIVVDNTVILELKARPTLERHHESQLLNLLRGTRFEVGLLLNFGPRPQVKRLIFSNTRKAGR